MTPERKHELNKLMAEVVGKTVREDYVEVHGPNGVTKELAWVDENQFLWDPVDDANDSEVVEEAVRDQKIMIEYASYANKQFGCHASLYTCDPSLKYSSDGPSRRVAFALAVEQWWEYKKGQT